MGYRIIADRLGKTPFGYAPIRPEIDPNTGQLVRWRTGRVLPGEDFEWRGDPEWPPLWCSPYNGDKDAEKAYRNMAKIQRSKSPGDRRHMTQHMKRQDDRIQELERLLDESREKAKNEVTRRVEAEKQTHDAREALTQASKPL